MCENVDDEKECCTSKPLCIDRVDDGVKEGTNLDHIREHYSEVAVSGSSCCGTSACNNVPNTMTLREAAERLGYTAEQLDAIPQDMEFSFGCGNPVAMASLLPGETIVDLGSGAGFDCAIASKMVGPTGKVIGVDMTPEMLSRARSALSTVDNIEFHLGEIEHLPVADASVDVVISNCVINLSQDKPQVFREMLRVLRPGGRVAISDVVRLRSFEGTRWENDEHLSECISGSVPASELKTMMAEAGLVHIRIVLNESSAEFISDWDPDTGVEAYICSALIEARRPE